MVLVTALVPLHGHRRRSHRRRRAQNMCVWLAPPAILLGLPTHLQLDSTLVPRPRPRPSCSRTPARIALRGSSPARLPEEIHENRRSRTFNQSINAYYYSPNLSGPRKRCRPRIAGRCRSHSLHVRFFLGRSERAIQGAVRGGCEQFVKVR